MNQSGQKNTYFGHGGWGDTLDKESSLSLYFSSPTYSHKIISLLLFQSIAHPMDDTHCIGSHSLGAHAGRPWSTTPAAA
jgi:hypothetical protein